MFIIYIDAFDSGDLNSSNNVNVFVITANRNMDYRSSTNR